MDERTVDLAMMDGAAVERRGGRGRRLRCLLYLLVSDDVSLSRIDHRSVPRESGRFASAVPLLPLHAGSRPRETHAKRSSSDFSIRARPGQWPVRCLIPTACSISLAASNCDCLSDFDIDVHRVTDRKRHPRIPLGQPRVHLSPRFILTQPSPSPNPELSSAQPLLSSISDRTLLLILDLI